MIRSCIPVRVISNKKICFREAADIIDISNRSKSLVKIYKDDKIASTDSIISLIKIAVQSGNKILVTATGEEPEKTVSEIIRFLK